ncbi:MAG: GntR family transcriptional regulator [Caldilineaceae bacterium]|nr:GntR family transcriptional regulator [Caldilineaceae bacterium]
MVSTSILAVSSRQRGDPDSLNGLAYQQLKDKIISLALPPASVIDEHSLASELGIGLTPVRQALRRLAFENFVVILPRRGTLVADLNPHDLYKIFEMRLELETLAARLAAERATPEQLTQLEEIATEALGHRFSNENEMLLALDHQMHTLLAQAAHNEFLAETLEWLYGHVLRLWNVSLHRVTGLQSAMAEHHAIFVAVRDRDANQAAALMRHHIHHFQQAFLAR